MGKQEMVMSVEGQQQDVVLGSALLRHSCPQREMGRAHSFPSRGIAGHTQAWTLCPNFAHLSPDSSVTITTHDPQLTELRYGEGAPEA